MRTSNVSACKQRVCALRTKKPEANRRKFFQSLRSVIRLTSIATGVVSVVIHHTDIDALQKEKIKQVQHKNKYRTEEEHDKYKMVRVDFSLRVFFSLT